MRKIIGLMVMVGALIFSQNTSASEIRREVVASASLGRDFPFLVYVPDGYTTSRRYPVLYLLHGAGGDENAWERRGGIQRIVDKLISRGTIPPVLVVMPGCPECWWVDGARDKAETAFWRDLVPEITKRYSTLETREGLLIGGVSAGGYGAIRYALKYPERIGAIAAFSPAVYANTPPPQSAVRVQPAFRGLDGKFSQPAWAEHNYPSLITAYFAQPLRVPIYLVSGDNDQFGIAYETALLFKVLFEKQPERVELRVVDGGHSWAVWNNAAEDAFTYLFRVTNPAVAAGPLQSSAP